ncbi:hypothetical protein ACX80V_17025 [Arthrobacter sp. MDT3-24]
MAAEHLQFDRDRIVVGAGDQHIWAAYGAPQVVLLSAKEFSN